MMDSEPRSPMPLLKLAMKASRNLFAIIGKCSGYRPEDILNLRQHLPK